MKRILANAAWMVMLLGALCAHGQVIGLNPTPLALYCWNSTTNEWQASTNASTAEESQNTPQAIALYGYNATLGQWTPFLASGGTCAQGSGSGSVTSVGLAMPSIFTVTGSPITTSGTFGVTLANENANTVFAGPASGSAAAPTFRSLVASDIPNLPQYQGAITLTTTGTSGAATLIGDTLNIPQYSGGSSGVGAITPSTGIACSPESGGQCTGSNVSVSSTVTGIYLPQDAVVIYTGTSENIDDEHVLSPAIAVASWSTTSGTTTVTTPAASSIYQGQWINALFLTGWPATPAYMDAGTGYTLFQVESVLSSTQFTIDTSLISAGACASGCGNIYSAMPYLGYAAASQPGMPSALIDNTYVFLAKNSTLASTATNFTNLFSSISSIISGHPVYLVVNGPNNDLAGCAGSSPVETSYQSIFSQAHAKSWYVVAASPIAMNYPTSGCNTMYQDQATVDLWLTGQGKDTVIANSPSSTQYWDMFADIGRGALDNASIPDYVASNGGLGPKGAEAAAQIIASTLKSGSGVIYSRSTGFYGTGIENSTSNANGIVYAPLADGSWAFQFWNAARTHMAVAIDTSTYGLHLDDSGSYIDIRGSSTCPGGRAFCIGLGFNIDGNSGLYGDLWNVNSLHAYTGGSTSTCWNTAGGTTACSGGSSGIAVQNAGTPLGTATTLNCSTGTSCSFSSGTATITASGGGSSGFVQIDQTVVSTGVSTITFSSIPGTYTNLKLVATMASGGNASVYLQFNGDSGAHYNYGILYAVSTSPTAVQSSSQTALQIGNASAGTGSIGQSVCDIGAYAATNFYKLVNCNEAYPTSTPSIQLGLLNGDWTSTAAITSITLSLSGGNQFQAGTTVTLYGEQ